MRLMAPEFRLTLLLTYLPGVASDTGTGGRDSARFFFAFAIDTARSLH